MIPTILVIQDNTLNLELVRDVLQTIDTRTLDDRIRALLVPGRPSRSAGGKAA